VHSDRLFCLYLATVSRYFSYLNSAVKILSSYTGKETFPSFIKKFFSANKKYGSKDRKAIMHLCYCFFRTGKAFAETIEERIALGLFLCSQKTNDLLLQLKPGWNEEAGKSIEEKMQFIAEPLLLQQVFPWKDELNESIDFRKFVEAFFIQPDVFLRLRPGKEKKVKEKLLSEDIPFREIGSHSIAIANATNIEKLVQLNEDAVVQDLNSQEVAGFFPLEKERSFKVWDCCAASGGKSIMMYDENPDIQLTVSDIRETILINLKKRFDQAGIKKYRSFVFDLASSKKPPVKSEFDLVVCDAPCTGSGTWSRNPEQLFLFDTQKIDHYTAVQKQIVRNVIPYLNKGGYLLYITCSVFKKENELIVDFIKQDTLHNFDVLKMEMLKGYDKKADTLFAALLRKL
jgi:16S rRNA (cytosine967-C5)-methyltransferase